MIIGVDIGTSVTKAVAYDSRGTSVAKAETESDVRQLPGGVVEQDMEQVIGTVDTVVREVSAELAEPVTAVAFTGQGDGLWLRDAEGNAVRPVISWLDARADAVLAKWQADGVAQEVFNRTGSGMFPGCAATLLSYLDEQEPDALDRAAVAGYCVDAVVQRLTGRITVDVSNASLPFLNPTTRQYDDDALVACGLSHRRGLLAEPAAPGEVFHLDAVGAELLGLPEGLPVTAGPFDLPACAIGAGVREPGDGILTAGTTLACQVLTTRPDFAADDEPAGMFLSTPYEGYYLRAMPAMVGTAGIDWACGLLGIDVSEVSELLALSPPGARGVHALPFLSSSGERAPFVDASARAQLTGLTLQHSRADVLRALCESIAYAARHCFEAAGLSGRLYACGGGVRSPEWTQMFADVLGREIVLPSDPGVGTRGAALAGAHSLGRSVDTAEWTKPAAIVAPDPENTAFYESGYTEYQCSLTAARRMWAVT